MFSQKPTHTGVADVMENSTTATTSFKIDRYERSPLEFEGSLLFESDCCDLPDYQAGDSRYRVRVYHEAGRDFVLEVGLVDDVSVLFQTADFAESIAEVDDLLCLVHEDAMDGLVDSGQFDASQRKAIGHRLETQLCRLSTRIVERITDLGTR